MLPSMGLISNFRITGLCALEGRTATCLSYPLPNSLVFALIAWSIYEYAITVDHEVKVLGQQKWMIASWIFIVNRYLLLASAILQLASLNVIGGSPGSLLAASVVAFIINTAQYTVITVFSALRVYAIWDHSVSLSLFALVLNSGQAVINISLLAFMPTFFSQILVQPSICSLEYSEPLPIPLTAPNYSTLVEESAPFLVASIVSRCLAGAVDIVILWLTWKKTYRSWARASTLGVRTPVTALLLRDGTAYFLALIVLIVVQLVYNSGFGGPASIYTINQGIISEITPTFACILISRFLMNLRYISDHPNNTVQTEPGSRFSVPGFRIPSLRTIIGNLGEDLDYGPSDGDVEERCDDGALQNIH